MKLLFHFPCRLQSTPGLLPDPGSALGFSSTHSALLPPLIFLHQGMEQVWWWWKRDYFLSCLMEMSVSQLISPDQLSQGKHLHYTASDQRVLRSLRLIAQRCPPAPLLDPKHTRHSSQPHPGAGAPPHPTARAPLCPYLTQQHAQPAPALPPLQSSVSQPVPSGFMAGEPGMLPFPMDLWQESWEFSSGGACVELQPCTHLIDPPACVCVSLGK